MNSKVYRDISDEMQKRRERAKLISIKRKEEIIECIPEITQLDDEINKLGIKLGFSAINGRNTESVNELKIKLNQFIRKKEDLIKKKGFPKNYLENVYECEICKDTGLIEKSFGYERCACFKKLMIEKLLSDSNVQRCGGSFEDFDINMYPDKSDRERYGIVLSPRESQERILNRCIEFVDSFNNTKSGNMVFIGKAGLGKTHLCNSIAIALLEKGIPVLYLTAPMMFANLAGVYSQVEAEREASYELHNLILTADLLIIDDLGTERQTATRYAELLEILNSREILSKKRPCKTIISTNLEPKNIYDYYGERVASRILGGFDMLRFTGDDIRIKQKMHKIQTNN